jgi:integrase
LYYQSDFDRQVSEREIGEAVSIYKRGKTYHTDVTVNGIRFRESLETTNWQEAQRKQKELIARASEGKAAPPAAKGSFATLPLNDGLDQIVVERTGRVSERTTRIDKERSKVLKRIIGETPIRKIDPEIIRTYQNARVSEGVKGRTINLEVNLLRIVLKRAKRWSVMADEVRNMPESRDVIGRVLTLEEKQKLISVASSKSSWMVAYCAAVIAVSSTCRKVELMNLQWLDVDLFARTFQIRRSKTAAGHRLIPMNADSLEAFVRLRQRAEKYNGGAAEHFVFPACERQDIDFTKPQKSLRNSWRNLTVSAGLKGFRFHDLRHQAITELAESGAADATMMALAGHVSKRMLDHYSHVRMAAKRSAVDSLGGGLMQSTTLDDKPVSGKPSCYHKRRVTSQPTSQRGFFEFVDVGNLLKIWWARRDSNPGPPACEAGGMFHGACADSTTLIRSFTT